MLIALLGLYLIAWFVSRILFHHDVGTAALQAFVITVPTAPFIGTPILNDLYGSSSIVSIAISAIIMNVIQVPLTLVLVELGQTQNAGKHFSLNQILQSSVSRAIKAPVAWVPALAIALVLFGVKVPGAVDKMLTLIGVATSGVSVFCSGLTLAAHKLKLNREVIVNSVLKMIVQPLLMVVLVLWLSIPHPDAPEGILICALPTSVVGIILASRFQMYESEASSTLLLTSMMMIATLPIAIALISH
ncbi:AEC family transporter [Oculatella sp. LEGE 06141]|nr:AEC family transporter [Oculatella sp. LEGE 06141]MBE9182263.1 AEC family transporter [Oculatella sp. LEGE 06141]